MRIAMVGFGHELDTGLRGRASARLTVRFSLATEEVVVGVRAKHTHEQCIQCDSDDNGLDDNGVKLRALLKHCGHTKGRIGLRCGISYETRC